MATYMGSVDTDASVSYNKTSVNKEFSWIGDDAPVFGITGKSVQVLTEPKQFYEALKVKKPYYLYANL